MLRDILDLVLAKCEEIGWQRIGLASVALFFVWRVISLAMLYSLKPVRISPHKFPSQV
jgi:hypothetical protein